jgi:hypothetical protein
MTLAELVQSEREKRTEVPKNTVRAAARIDAKSAERGGKGPRKPRPICARKTSSASGRENVSPVDANLMENAS